MEEFYTIARFPGVSGCIDCTHVPIRSPGGDDAEVFRCRKGYFSINVQAITGPRLQFFYFDASWPGSAHDSRIFDNSRARVQYEEGNVPGILLGDKGYPCRSYLMTPFRERQSSPQLRYNKCHSRTRCSVERTFGVWKRRFPCLEMTLRIKTRSVPIVITACAALHNFGHLLRDPVPPPAQSQLAQDRLKLRQHLALSQQHLGLLYRERALGCLWWSVMGQHSFQVLLVAFQHHPVTSSRAHQPRLDYLQ
nr:putative nuclease HARBI1 [Dermacentor andersoni]